MCPCAALCARFQGLDGSRRQGDVFGPLSAEMRGRGACGEEAQGRFEKRQAESPDAFLRRGSHFCPQCGQFQEILFDAFQSAARWERCFFLKKAEFSLGPWTLKKRYFQIFPYLEYR